MRRGGNMNSSGGGRVSRSRVVLLVFVSIAALFLANTLLISFHLDNRMLQGNAKGVNIKVGGGHPVSKVESITGWLHGMRGGGDSAANTDRYEWVSPNVQYRRSVHGEGEIMWEEIQDGEVKFKFTEATKNKDGSFLLNDRVRSVSVMLTAIEAKFRTEAGGVLGEWISLSSGRWHIKHGKVVDDPVSRAGGPQPPHPQLADSEINTATVLVMLAAYRDPLCGNTLFEAFKQAKFPNRVRAAVVQQNSPDDPDCLAEYCRLEPNCRRSQVKLITIPLEKSRGVMPARFAQHLLIEQEQFCLQADAHSAFEDDWDVMAITDWKNIGNEMAVVTAYPNRVADRHGQKLTPARCSTQFDFRKEVVHGGNAAHNTRPNEKGFLIPFFGAGTAFNKCHANLNVPYDPYMSYLFGGEEFNRAARLWTWGYDMYAPKHNFVFHYYDSEEKPVWARAPRKRDFVDAANFKGEMAKQAVARWRTVLGLTVPPRISKLTTKAMENADLYGLGNRRTLKDYLEFSGVDLVKAKSESRCNMLGRMEWHPFEYDPATFNPNCYGNTCCTTMDLVRHDAEKLLDLTNNEYSSLIQDSSSEHLVQHPQPIVSPLSSGALQCPAHDV